MAATVQTLIKKGFKIHSKGIPVAFKQKLDLFSPHFGSIKSFLSAKKEDFEKLVFVVDNPSVKLTDKDYFKILSFQQSGILDAKLSVQQNFIKILTADFLLKQLQMIENLKLENLNVNPILAGALNLNNASDLIRYYVYQSISRSFSARPYFVLRRICS